MNPQAGSPLGVWRRDLISITVLAHPHPASHLTTTASIPLRTSNFPRNQNMETPGRPDPPPHFAQVRAPGEAKNDLPKATDVAGTEWDQKLGVYLRKAPALGLSPRCHPVEPALWPDYHNGALQPRCFGPGQGQAKRVRPDGSRISPGSGAQPLRPGAAAAAAAGACVAMGLGLRADADRPPLPHASRTNKTLRSGLCEGLVAGRERRARGLDVALGDVVPVFAGPPCAPPAAAAAPARLCG